MAAFFTDNRSAPLAGAFLSGLALIALTGFFASLAFLAWVLLRRSMPSEAPKTAPASM